MRILHITFSLMNGGKENMLVDIAAEQQKAGHELAIVVVNNLVDESILERIQKAIRIWNLGRNQGSKSSIPFLKLFDILHRRFRPDVVHAHDVYMGGLLRKLRAGKAVLTIHDNGIPVAPMANFHKLFAISNSVKFDVESRTELECTTIYNGLPFRQIKAKSKKHKTDKYINLIQVSRLNHEKKGQDLLLEAMHELVHTMRMNYLKLTFVGSGDSSVFLQQMTKRLGLQNHVYFLGNKPREWVYENLANYDIFVQASRFEGFGITVAEAVAAKLLTITSSNTGSSEVIGEGKYGIIFKNGDSSDLVRTIKTAIRKLKNAEADQMINAAYLYCMENYDIEMTASNYIANYLKTQASPPRKSIGFVKPGSNVL